MSALAKTNSLVGLSQIVVQVQALHGQKSRVEIYEVSESHNVDFTYL